MGNGALAARRQIPADSVNIGVSALLVSSDPVFVAQAGRCFYCGQPMRNRGSKRGAVPPGAATRDHLIPRSAKVFGGLDAINHVWAHQRCNVAKGSRLPTRDQAARFVDMVEAIGRVPHWLAVKIAGREIA
jgi:5-methylcytosine-specific restriction endonuclease McrA